MPAPTRICFVSMEVYPILKPGAAELAGGAGFQLVQLATGLRDRGWSVAFVVGDFGQDEHEVIDGFDVYRANRVAYDRSKLRGLANLWRLFNAMRKARARHYVLRSTRFLSFFVMVYARLLGARYTFMVANLPHCLRTELEGLSPVFRRLYWTSVRFANRITTQSREQQVLFRENFGILAPVVPNGIEIPPYAGPILEAPHDISWVASFKVQKRADVLLEIAKLLPHRKFIVAGGPGNDAAYSRDLMDRLAREPNVEFLGFVTPDRVGEVYTAARLHLSTSDWEGFPNAFLYAWTRGVPACSLKIDPDRVVTEQDLGIVDPDKVRLAEKMDVLLADTDRYVAMSRRCYDHVVATNSLDQAVSAFIEALP